EKQLRAFIQGQSQGERHRNGQSVWQVLRRDIIMQVRSRRRKPFLTRSADSIVVGYCEEKLTEVRRI
ncbi:hypothetical protein M514_07161, partial [Trichuris suis]